MCEACRDANKARPVECAGCTQERPLDIGINRLVAWAFQRLSGGLWDGMGGVNVQGIAAGLEALGVVGRLRGLLTEKLIDLAGMIQTENRKRRDVK